MPLKAVVKDIEQIEETQRSLYRHDEESGMHILDVESVDGWSLEDVQGLKKALGAARGNVSDLEGKLYQFEGIDPKKAKQALKKVDEFSKIDPEKEADRIAEEKFKSVESQLVEKHTSEKAELQGEIQSLKGLVDKLGVDAKLDIAMDKAGVIPEGKDILKPYVRKFLKPEIKGDDLEVNVIDENGGPIIKDGSANHMDLNDLVVSMKEKLPHIFKGSGQSGSSSKTSNQASQTYANNPYTKGSWNLTEQMKLENKNPDLAKKMEAAAQ